MTYQDALERKAKIGTTISKDGVTYRVLVAPSKVDDFTVYIGKELSNVLSLTDDVSKKYSSDQMYRVAAFSVNFSDNEILVINEIKEPVTPDDKEKEVD